MEWAIDRTEFNGDTKPKRPTPSRVRAYKLPWRDSLVVSVLD